MTDFRALCAELVKLLEVSEEWSGCTQPQALTRARAALAEQLVEPTRNCTNKKCNYEVRRYKSKDNPLPKSEKVKLSPAAQAVLDAAINVAESPDAEAIAAAALRAVADELASCLFIGPNEGDIKCVIDLSDLHDLIDELEDQ